MTRWARGSQANRKKPLDASDWSELKAQKVSEKRHAAEEDVGKTAAVDQLLSKSKPKTKCGKSKVDLSMQNNQEKELQASEKEQNVVAELEKLGKEASLTGQLVDKVELEEFVRKDERREARRLKRQQMKQQARVCFNCRQKGHDLASCPQVIGDVDHGTGVCFKCGSTEHKVQQCRVKVPHGKFPFAKCFICNEVGHLSRSCPDNPRGLYPNGGSCNHCGSVEHFKKDCPELQKQKGITETTLTTLDRTTKVDEEPALKRPRPSGPPPKKTKVIKF
jgi:zinc finger CCHC domain-containing protein 9